MIERNRAGVQANWLSKFTHPEYLRRPVVHIVDPISLRRG
jgi:hypothetical protein